MHLLVAALATDVVGDVVLAAQLLVLVVAALVAWSQVGEAKRLREQQIRPFVVVDFDTDKFLFFVRVANLGNVLARNVKISISPELRSSLDTSDELIRQLQMFREGIPTLAPGKEIRTLFDSSIQRDRKQFPDVYHAEVTYDDATLKRSFHETITLDLGIYWDTQRIDRADLDDLHKQLDAIADTIKSWRADFGGLLHVTPQDVEARRTASRAQRESSRRHAGENDKRDSPT